MAAGTVKTGLMRVLEDEGGLGAKLKGKRLGMLVNPTSVDGGLVHAVDRALAKGWKPWCGKPSTSGPCRRRTGPSVAG